jgi:hypothetical protein
MGSKAMKWVQLNCRISDTTISSLGKTSANCIIRRQIAYDGLAPRIPLPALHDHPANVEVERNLLAIDQAQRVELGGADPLLKSSEELSYSCGEARRFVNGALPS